METPKNCCHYCRKQEATYFLGNEYACSKCYGIGTIPNTGMLAIKAAKEYADKIHTKETVTVHGDRIEKKKVTYTEGYTNTFWNGFAIHVAEQKMIEDYHKTYANNLGFEPDENVSVKKTKNGWFTGCK